MLEKTVLDIVNDHSGGIKFTELISIIVAKNEEEHLGLDIDNDFPTVLENTIRASSKLKILDYTWQPMSRAKMFVYTE